MIQPVQPGLEHVFTISAEIGERLNGGAGLCGERLHIPITGGTVTGPRLTGKIVPGGSDWPLIRPDGNSEVSAHYSIVLDDGSPILVHNIGLRVSPAPVLARLRAGEAVDPSEYYFRTFPRFDVPDGPHQWLREHLFIGSAAPSGNRVVIDIYLVN